MNRDQQIIPISQNQNLIEVISKELPSLNKTQAKVARVILSDPKLAMESSIAVLAKKSAVSEPSVNRFCKRFNAKGFPDLKLKLASALATNRRFANPIIDPCDDVASYTPKVFDNTINHLALVRERICHNRINQVIDRLIRAKRIYFFGLGASATVAQEAENQFSRLALPAFSQVDILMQRQLVSVAMPGDVFFIISTTGQVKEIVEIAKTAIENKSEVIALTSPESLLADHCSIALFADVNNYANKYLPLSSRVVHQVILDVLVAGIALRRDPDFINYLEDIKNNYKLTEF